MRRRPPQPGTPLNLKQEELAQQENQLRGEMEKLERMIAEAPRVAEETTRQQRGELLARASEGRSPLNGSTARQDRRWGGEGHSPGRRKSVRKERPPGRSSVPVLGIGRGSAING